MLGLGATKTRIVTSKPIPVLPFHSSAVEVTATLWLKKKFKRRVLSSSSLSKHQRAELTLCSTVFNHQTFPGWFSTMTDGWQGSWHSSGDTRSIISAAEQQHSHHIRGEYLTWGAHKTTPGCASHLKPRCLCCMLPLQLPLFHSVPLFLSVLKFKKLMEPVVLKEIQLPSWIVTDT